MQPTFAAVGFVAHGPSILDHAAEHGCPDCEQETAPAACAAACAGLATHATPTAVDRGRPRTIHPSATHPRLVGEDPAPDPQPPRSPV